MLNFINTIVINKYLSNKIYIVFTLAPTCFTTYLHGKNIFLKILILKLSCKK